MHSHAPRFLRPTVLVNLPATPNLRQRRPAVATLICMGFRFCEVNLCRDRISWDVDRLFSSVVLQQIPHSSY